jgi:hypothetical protein
LIGQLEAMHGPASRALAWQLGLHSKTMAFSKRLILQEKLFIGWFGLALAQSHPLAPAYGGRQSTIMQLWAFSVSFNGPASITASATFGHSASPDTVTY